MEAEMSLLMANQTLVRRLKTSTRDVLIVPRLLQEN